MAKKKKKETVFPPLWGERSEVDNPEVEEAKQRIFKFKHNLEVADKVFDQILIHKDWLTIGFSSFAEWWRVDIMPILHSLQVQPKDNIVEAGIKQVLEDNATLPPAQRVSQREMGEMFGVSQPTISRSISDSNESDVDLGGRTKRAKRTNEIIEQIDKISELEAQATLDRAAAEDLEVRRTQLRHLEFAEIVHSMEVARHELVKTVSEVRTVGLRFEGSELMDLLSLLEKLAKTIEELRLALTEPKTDLDEELKELLND